MERIEPSRAGKPVHHRLKSHRGFRAFWYQDQDQERLPEPWTFTTVVVTNAGYARAWRLPWDQRDEDPQLFFERTLDVMIGAYEEGYEQYGDEVPVPLDHDVNWKGEPCDFQIQEES